jgi:glycosyltransferase involved in cell wall biosynthesis
LKVALVHDWLTGMRGGERVLETLCQLYPEADLYTLLHVKGRLSGVIEGMKINTSFVQRFPGVSKYYRYYLPLFPTAIEQFDLRGYDLIISSSHCVAKGIVPMPDALHISYCHTPMRYVWDAHFEYFGDSGTGLKRFMTSALANYLRAWDVTSSQRVDEFIANSRFVQQRIKKYYRRESTVIHPPVDCDYFRPATELKGEGFRQGDYFLMVTALVPYKRVDLAIEAFNRMGKPLLIVGDGQGMDGLKKRAHKKIEFLGWQKDGKVREYYQGCRALIFPGKEDFGITPVEAQACGKPVIAYGKGGILETVRPLPQEKPTGVFFDQPTVESLVQAVDQFERNQDRFDPHAIQCHAFLFDQKIFRAKIQSFIREKYQAFGESPAQGESSC